MNMSKADKFFNDITPLFTSVLGLSLVDIHLIASVLVTSVSAIYTVFKIKKDFFSNNKRKNKNNG